MQNVRVRYRNEYVMCVLFWCHGAYSLASISALNVSNQRSSNLWRVLITEATTTIQSCTIQRAREIIDVLR